MGALVAADNESKAVRIRGRMLLEVEWVFSEG